MDLIIEDDVRTLFPRAAIAVVVFEHVDNESNDSDLERLKSEQVAETRAKMTREELGQHPHVQAWREAYRHFGADPRRKRPSAEALLRRILKEGRFPEISPMVDLYCVASVRYALPVGGYDLDRIVGDIRLRRSMGNEEFNALGTDALELTDGGEVVYVDGERVLTRHWNHRDCSATRIERQSRRVALFCETPGDAVPMSALRECAMFIAELGERHCRARSSVLVLDSTSDRIPIYKNSTH